uniref:Uncharacterized protein n=1 Tax=Rhizophora mucronata TaxID=61149 RepID=A0A2P2LW67_RHIMU
MNFIWPEPSRWGLLLYGCNIQFFKCMESMNLGAYKLLLPHANFHLRCKPMS